jgi:glutamyl-tRNA synthetase
MRQADEALAQEWLKWLKAEKNLEPEKKIVVKIVSLVKERVNFVQELWDEAYFFFETPESYDEKVVKKRWKTDSPQQMEILASLLDNLEGFSADKIDEKIKNWIIENELSMGGIMNALRLLLVGAAKGPHLGDIMEVLGKAESIKRIRSGIKALSN